MTSACILHVLIQLARGNAQTQQGTKCTLYLAAFVASAKHSFPVMLGAMWGRVAGSYFGRDRNSILLLFLRVTTMSPQRPTPLPTVFTSFTSWYAASSLSAAQQHNTLCADSGTYGLHHIYLLCACPSVSAHRTCTSSVRCPCPPPSQASVSETLRPISQLNRASISHQHKLIVAHSWPCLSI